MAFENDSFAIVTFGVINGTLQREVAVDLSFAGVSAIGELILFHNFIVFILVSIAGGDFLLDAAGAYILAAF